MKKFTAFIAFNDEFRNLYYDIAESQGIESVWDVYHIQEGREFPKQNEVSIMKTIFETRILTNERVLEVYSTADLDFRRNVSEKIRIQK